MSGSVIELTEVTVGDLKQEHVGMPIFIDFDCDGRALYRLVDLGSTRDEIGRRTMTVAEFGAPDNLEDAYVEQARIPDDRSVCLVSGNLLGE